MKLLIVLQINSSVKTVESVSIALSHVTVGMIAVMEVMNKIVVLLNLM